jgi:hypothetical protein
MLPLEVPLELPIEILKEIALKSPAAYLLLVQTTKKIHFDKDVVMRHFTTYRPGVDGYNCVLGYRLPNGNLHTINDATPSIIINGHKLWYYNNQRHRDNDLPASIFPTGAEEWWKHGEKHRDNDLPAHVNGAYMTWWQHGKRHRERGLPAIIHCGGTLEYYLHGVEYFPE